MASEGGVESGGHLAKADSGTWQGEVIDAGLASPVQPAQAGADEGQEPEQSHAHADAAASPNTEERKPDSTPAGAEGKRRRGRPPGSLNRKTLVRMEAARMLQADAGLQGGQQWQVQRSVTDVLERPDILASAAANLGLVASAWPSTKLELGTSSAVPSCLPASTNGAVHLGATASAAAATALALAVGQPHTPANAGAPLGRPGGQGLQQFEPRAAPLVEGPSAAHLLVQQQGSAARAAPSARGLVDLVSVIAGQTASTAGLGQPGMLLPGMACGGALARADSTAGGQAEPPPRRKRGRPLGSKNKKTLAAQQWPANGAALVAAVARTQQGAAQHAALGAAASTAPAPGSMPPAQEAPVAAHEPAHAVQGAEAACASPEPAGAGAQLQAAPARLHAHAPAAPQVALLLPAGAAGRQPGLAGNIYAMTLAAQVSNGAVRGAAVSPPAAGNGALPGVCPAKRGRPKGSKDSKPRKPRTPKPAKLNQSLASPLNGRTPKPAKLNQSLASPLNGQALEGNSSAYAAGTPNTLAQQPLAV